MIRFGRGCFFFFETLFRFLRALPRRRRRRRPTGRAKTQKTLFFLSPPFPFHNNDNCTGGPLIDEQCYIVQAFVGGGTLKRVVAAQNEATKASLSSSVPASAAAASAASAAVGPSSSRSPSSSSSAPVASIRCFYTHEDAATWGAQIAEGLAYLHGEQIVSFFFFFNFCFSSL